MGTKLAVGIPAGQHRRTGQIVNEQAGKWSFLTSHARVLIVVLTAASAEASARSLAHCGSCQYRTPLVRLCQPWAV